MSLAKELIKKHKQIEVQIKSLTKKRLNGWQLKSFEESYKYKVENGISLIKKKNLK